MHQDMDQTKYISEWRVISFWLTAYDDVAWESRAKTCISILKEKHTQLSYSQSVQANLIYTSWYTFLTLLPNSSFDWKAASLASTGELPLIQFYSWRLKCFERLIWRVICFDDQLKGRTAGCMSKTCKVSVEKMKDQSCFSSNSTSILSWIFESFKVCCHSHNILSFYFTKRIKCKYFVKQKAEQILQKDEWISLPKSWQIQRQAETLNKSFFQIFQVLISLNVFVIKISSWQLIDSWKKIHEFRKKKR